MDAKYQKLFWEKVNKTSDCWLWTGALTEKGYGVAWDGKRTQKAHRISYMLKFGHMPKQCVLHKCDVPNCVNPGHLFTGTRLENNMDMIRKGRRVVGGTYKRDGYKVGEEHGGSKLTEGDIKNIREEYASGATSYSRLADAYGLSIAHAYRIVNRKAWKHVEDYFAHIAARLRRVRVCCGDWSRVLGPTPTEKLGVTGILLDPPYADTADRQADLYGVDSLSVAHDVREWAIANGDNPLLRIALCGYEGEHQMPDGWSAYEWKAPGGFGSQGNGTGRANAARERIWFSPHCIPDRVPLSLFSMEGL